MDRRRLWRWTLRLVGLALVLFALHAAIRFPWHDTGAALRGANPRYLLLAAALNLVALVARGWSWHVLLRPSGTHRWWSAQLGSLLGAAIGSVSIAVAGEGARVRLVVKRDGVDPGLALAAVVWSRLVEGMALVPLLVIAPFVVTLPPLLRTAYYWLGLVVGAILLVVLLRRWIPFSVFLPGFARQGLDALRRIRTQGGSLALPFIFCLVHWVTQWATFGLTFRAVGIDVGRGASFIALVLANIAWTIRFTPGNVGVMQGSIAVALLPFDVSAAHAVVAGLVLQAVQTLPILALAAVMTGGRHFVSLVRQEETD